MICGVRLWVATGEPEGHERCGHAVAARLLTVMLHDYLLTPLKTDAFSLA